MIFIHCNCFSSSFYIHVCTLNKIADSYSTTYFDELCIYWNNLLDKTGLVEHTTVRVQLSLMSVSNTFHAASCISFYAYKTLVFKNHMNGEFRSLIHMFNAPLTDTEVLTKYTFIFKLGCSGHIVLPFLHTVKVYYRYLKHKK